MSILRRVAIAVIIEIIVLGFFGGAVLVALLDGKEGLRHEELPLYRAYPEIVGPLVARELATIAPMEIEALCGAGYSKQLYEGWKYSGLPRIDRIRRNLGDKRIVIRAVFENARGYERALYQQILCRAEVFERWSPNDPRLDLISPTVLSYDKS